jgi:hypothetical protein
MLALQGEAEAAGAMVVLRAPVLSGRVRDEGFELLIGGEEPAIIRCRCVVNAPGFMHRPSPAPSTGCREKQSRPPISAEASIFRSPVGHHSGGSPIWFRHPAAWVCT